MNRKFLTRTAAAFAASALALSALAADLTNAEVRRVDRDTRKITLKHEHIKSLDMPPMTMIFGVKDAKLLDKVKAGDKVRFAAVDEGGGKLVVTELEAAK
jgi:Cu(I)/Ag(I) efflux system periplasmic protein CusF